MLEFFVYIYFVMMFHLFKYAKCDVNALATLLLVGSTALNIKASYSLFFIVYTYIYGMLLCSIIAKMPHSFLLWC